MDGGGSLGGLRVAVVLASCGLVGGCYASHGAADEEWHDGPPPPPAPRDCPSREPVWARTFPTNGGADVAIGPDGNLYLAGTVYGSGDFGRGFHDIRVASMSTDGDVRWVKRFGGSSGGCLEGATAIDVDGDGNLYIAGAFQGTLEAAGRRYTSGGSCDAFVASVTPRGRFRWFRQIAGGADGDMAWDVAVDDGSDRVVAAAVVGGAGESVPRIIGLGGAADVYFIAYDLSGRRVWTLRRGEAGGGAARGVGTDGRGNVYLSGVLRGSEDLGGGGLGPVDADGDAFVAGFTSSGAHRWSRRFAGRGLDEAVDIATHGSGDVIVTGLFEREIDFGPETLRADAQDAFVGAMSAEGEARWAARIGGPGTDIGFRAIGHPDGGAIVAGVSAGYTDALSAFVQRLSASGACVWQWRPGGDYAGDVARGSDGQVYAVGVFSTPADFGAGPVAPASEGYVSGRSARDMFVVKLPD